MRPHGKNKRLDITGDMKLSENAQIGQNID